MIFVIFAILLCIFVAVYIIKKECGNSTSNHGSQKYTVSEISYGVNALLESLIDRHSVVKVLSVNKSSPFLKFECLLYNHDHSAVKHFTATVRIPLSSNGKYILENASVSDSNEVIECGDLKVI